MDPLGSGPRRPWTPWQYLLIIALVVFVGVFVFRPMGLQIAAVFQQLTDAIKNGHS